MPITSQNEWVTKLEALCPELVALNLKRTPDYKYAEVINNRPEFRDADCIDAYNFANSDLHNDMIKRVVLHFINSNPNALKKLITDLTYRNTYGTLSELAGYDWLLDAVIPFDIQIPLTPQQVVNPRGIDADARITLGTNRSLLDIKGFGFIEHKRAILLNKLKASFPNRDVIIQGRLDVSMTFIQDLLGRDYAALVADLTNSPNAVRGAWTISVRPARRISMSVSTQNPINLAKENREYCMNLSSQFARQEPFLLFFVIHPWFSQSSLHQNFDGFVDHFCNEFALQTFYSFAGDTSLLHGLPKEDLAKMLSGLVFLNVWPQASSRGRGPRSRVYLNGASNFPLVLADFAGIASRFGNDFIVHQL